MERGVTKACGECGERAVTSGGIWNNISLINTGSSLEGTLDVVYFRPGAVSPTPVCRNCVVRMLLFEAVPPQLSA